MTRVGRTPGKGRGVFAFEEIAASATIEEAPVVAVPENEVTHLKATYFPWGDDEK